MSNICRFYNCKKNVSNNRSEDVILSNFCENHICNGISHDSPIVINYSKHRYCSVCRCARIIYGPFNNGNYCQSQRLKGEILCKKHIKCDTDECKNKVSVSIDDFHLELQYNNREEELIHKQITVSLDEYKLLCAHLYDWRDPKYLDFNIAQKYIDIPNNVKTIALVYMENVYYNNSCINHI